MTRIWYDANLTNINYNCKKIYIDETYKNVLGLVPSMYTKSRVVFEMDVCHVCEYRHLLTLCNYRDFCILRNDIRTSSKSENLFVSSIRQSLVKKSLKSKLNLDIYI